MQYQQRPRFQSLINPKKAISNLIRGSNTNLGTIDIFSFLSRVPDNEELESQAEKYPVCLKCWDEWKEMKIKGAKAGPADNNQVQDDQKDPCPDLWLTET